MVQEWPQGISKEEIQQSPKNEVGDILDEVLMSAMWAIWRSFTPSRIWNHYSYYIWIFYRVGSQNKEVSLIKPYGLGELSFSHLCHWSYLLMLFQQGRLCGDWREDVPKKYKRHSKRLLDSWIWYCWVFCQEWKLTFGCALGSCILYSWVTKGLMHHLPTKHSHVRRIQSCLNISFSLLAC